MSIPGFQADTGGSTFPVPDDISGMECYGLTKRDWFAGLAMIGLIVRGHDADGNAETTVAEEAYAQADNMLIAREP